MGGRLRHFLTLFGGYRQYGNGRRHLISRRKFHTDVRPSSACAPVFFLSTGRTGTLLFTNILSSSKGIVVYHSPTPELIREGKVAHELYRRYGFDNEAVNRALTTTVSAARDDMLFAAHVYGSAYVETNNRISFLAPALKAYYPSAKFVHLYRHPGEFVRSGVRRDWYDGKQDHDTGRIVPLAGSTNFERWDTYDDIEKIAWLWNETNSFIVDFLATLDPKDHFSFNLNELNTSGVSGLLDFVGAGKLSETKISTLISRPVNKQVTGSLQRYRDWSDSDKNKVCRQCDQLAGKFGYEL